MFEAESNVSPKGGRSAVRRGRAYLWGIVPVLLVLVLGLALFAPNIVASVPSWRASAVRGLLKGWPGPVQVESAAFCWWTPLELHGLELHDPEGRLVARVARLKTDKALFTLWQQPLTDRHYEILQPVVWFRRDTDQTNLDFLLDPDSRKGPPAPPKPAPQVGFTLVDATLHIESRLEAVPSDTDIIEESIRSIDLSATLSAFEPAVDEPRLLTVEPGRPLEEIEITPAVTSGALKFVAPVLAEATTSSGRFSVTLDHCEIPLDAPHESRVDGVVELHRVQVGPSRLAQDLAGGVVQVGQSLPKLGPLLEDVSIDIEGEPNLTLARDVSVPFRIEEQRVYHQDFRFGFGEVLPNADITTSGWVGFDETVDIEGRMPLPLRHLLKEHLPSDHPLVPRLGSLIQSDPIVTFRVTGTLEEPVVESPQLASGGVDDLVAKWANDMDERALTREGVKVALGILDALAERSERKAKEQGGEKPKRGLPGRVLNALGFGKEAPKRDQPDKPADEG